MYLEALQAQFVGHEGTFCGYGAAVADLGQVSVDWQGKDTYIQSLGIVQDFDLYASSDDVFVQHGQSLNHNVDSLRKKDTHYLISS